MKLLFEEERDVDGIFEEIYVDGIIEEVVLWSSPWFGTRFHESCARIYIDPVFARKKSRKRSFSVIENEPFGLVFAKTGSIDSGTEVQKRPLLAGWVSNINGSFINF
jgi:hypothetical protein